MDSNRVISVVSATVLLLVAGLWAWPQYLAYSENLNNSTRLSKAENSKTVLLLEAQAKVETAKMLASVEVEKAKGIADANRIINEGIKNNPDLLTYLWIKALESSNHSTIYVSLDNGVPVMNKLPRVGSTP